MTRIVAGVAGGRRLSVLAGQTTRPTSQRVREAMFSTLGSMLGPLRDVHVLDLYAGSGGLGLEALSRGAASCIFVERHPRVVAVLRRNVATTGLRVAQIVASDVRVALGTPPTQPCDLVLIDPPYAVPGAEVTEVLTALAARGWLADDAVVVVERSSRDQPPSWPDAFAVAQDRTYGQTRLWYLRRSDASTSAEG